MAGPESSRNPRAESPAGQLDALGVGQDEALVDGVMLPAAAAGRARAFAGGVGASLLVRTYPKLAEGAEGYGPLPVEPRLVRLDRKGGGPVDVQLAAGGAAVRAEARAIRVERTVAPCCEAAGCTFSREAIAVWLDLGGETLLVAEGRPLEGQPDDGATAFAGALATALGLHVDDASPREAAPPADPVAVDGGAAADAGPTARVLARFGARMEAGRLVLRDHANIGPRAAARQKAIAALGFAVVAVGLWIPAAQAALAGAGGRAAGFGSVALLLTITAYAFFGVARFAARYAASSTPLASFGMGRFVVAPWVARGGSIDLRLEGRLGAAIPCAEVSAVATAAREEGVAVYIESDHGQIDVVAVPEEALAVALADVVRRAVELSKHPTTQPSAKQRARAKGAAGLRSPA